MIQHTKKETLSKYFRVKIRILIFILIGIFLFIILQNVFVPKRFPYVVEYDGGKLKYFYNEKKESIDVIICGTSHPGRAILPMELYEKYGLKTYNFATSVQPIEVTYYILQEVLKTQTPKVLIWDISNLFYKDSNTPELWRWQHSLDDMPLSKNKILLAQEYLNKYDEAKETITQLLFPLLGYHTRWKELSWQDFKLNNNKLYYGKGGNITSIVSNGDTSIETMNTITNELIKNNRKIVYEYNDGEFNEWNEESVLYNTDISLSNIEWFEKIKELCTTNNIQLLAVKIPTVGAPQWHNSAWTKERYNKVRALCDEYNIAYYDLLYETNLDIDYKTDSYDGGPHLNFRGAQKASVNLGNYLISHYSLSQEHNDQWDKDLISYQKVRKVALLELEQDFVTYINMLANEYKDNTIFIVASDEMSQGLNEIDTNSLRMLGLQTDYSIALQHSYIVVIENGKVKYEALSNRPLNYTGICQNSGKRYELYSSGWWTGSGASIKLDGNEYAVNCRGLNIVVYDDKRGLVLDSVGFDTWAEYHTPVRNNGTINWLKEEFERYIMEVEDR